MSAPFDVPWWPPKVGDKLRKRENQVEYLCHVVSVFEHNDRHHVVLAWYGKHKQWWHYDVIYLLDCEWGKYWPNGQERPT